MAKASPAAGPPKVIRIFMQYQLGIICCNKIRFKSITHITMHVHFKLFNYKSQMYTKKIQNIQ
jgi:hypothetical protein